MRRAERIQAQLRNDRLARESAHRNRSDAQRLASCRTLLGSWRGLLLAAEIRRDEAKASGDEPLVQQYDRMARELRSRCAELSDALE